MYLSKLTVTTPCTIHRLENCRRLSGIRPLGLFRFQNLFSENYESTGQVVGLLGRVIGRTQGLYLHTGQHNTEKRRHTSMLRVGFEPTIPVFERPQTARPLGPADFRII
jgi:hypothetical protein